MPATLAPDRLLRPSVVVAAYPYAADVAIGGLLLALAEPAIPATIVVLAPRLFAVQGRSGATPERALAGLGESAQVFGAGIDVLDFSRQTIRDDPVAAAQLGQILRRRPRNLITNPSCSPNPDFAAACAITWRAALPARSGGGLIAGAPLERALELWLVGANEPSLPKICFATGEFAERKYELLSRIKCGEGDPLPDPEQLVRDRDLTDDGGSAEELFLVGQPW